MSRPDLAAVLFLMACGLAFGQAPSASVDQEWRSYGHDPGGMRFSPLKQINTSNVQRLQRAWTYEVAQGADGGIEAFETTPLMIYDVLYFTTPTSRALACNAARRKELWVFDPFAGMSGTRRPVPNRGVAYWEGESPVPCGGGNQKTDKRIFYPTLDGRLFGLDSRTGKPCSGFGDQGAIDLRKGIADQYPKAAYDVTSAPCIYKDLVITGSEVQEYPSKGASG